MTARGWLRCRFFVGGNGSGGDADTQAQMFLWWQPYKRSCKKTWGRWRHQFMLGEWGWCKFIVWWNHDGGADVGACVMTMRGWWQCKFLWGGDVGDIILLLLYSFVWWLRWWLCGCARSCDDSKGTIALQIFVGGDGSGGNVDARAQFLWWHPWDNDSLSIVCLLYYDMHLFFFLFFIQWKFYFLLQDQFTKKSLAAPRHFWRCLCQPKFVPRYCIVVREIGLWAYWDRPFYLQLVACISTWLQLLGGQIEPIIELVVWCKPMWGKNS